MNISIVVTHLLGTGHLARALTLGRAFADAGHVVHVLSGGMPAPHLSAAGVTLVQLAPLRSDGTDFTRLLDRDGAQVDAAYHAARSRILRDHLKDTPPDVLITELFPFGRRSLRTEFRALLDAAQALDPRPLICASIRDILAPPSKPKKAAFAEDTIVRHYDAVLVHADPRVTPLELSWPVTPPLAAKLQYTGFVAPPAPAPHPDRAGAHEIIVSAGGGDVGAHIFDTALRAAALDQTHRWRLLLGGTHAAPRSAQLAQHAPANVTVEAARPDFRQMLHHARASVCMCGYNTALDLLQTGCPAVLIPFDAGSEVEQGIRAQALAKRPGFTVLRAADLNAPALLLALARISDAPRSAPQSAGLDGAARTVEIVEKLRMGMT